MKKIIIIGGGFAGLWAAFSAIRIARIESVHHKISITLINKDPYHGLRPRFYESNLNNTRINLETFLIPLGINFIIGEVSSIDVHTRQVIVNLQQSYSYDKLIIATGSHLDVPDIPGLKDYGFNVDTYAAAKKLQQHLDNLSKKSIEGQYTIVVVGGGFTGVEAATELMNRVKQLASGNKARVIVLDRTQVASRFGLETKKVIIEAFDELGIESISNVAVKSIAEDHVVLTSGDIIKTQTVVWTAGMKSNALTQQFCVELDSFGRLPVDRFLRIQGVEHCFAAGDVAAATTDGTHMALLSCQHAMPQGRFAGNNAVADLFGKHALMYEQPKFVTSIDLGSWGALYAEGWDQHIVKIKESAKKIKIFINQDRIYPPSLEHGIDNLLAAAEPTFKEIKI